MISPNRTASRQGGGQETPAGSAGGTAFVEIRQDHRGPGSQALSRLNKTAAVNFLHGGDQPVNLRSSVFMNRYAAGALQHTAQHPGGKAENSETAAAVEHREHIFTG